MTAYNTLSILTAIFQVDLG